MSTDSIPASLLYNKGRDERKFASVETRRDGAVCRKTLPQIEPVPDVKSQYRAAAPRGRPMEGKKGRLVTDWHQKTASETLKLLESHAERGLTDEQVATRRERYGPNELVETVGRGPWRIVWE